MKQNRLYHFPIPIVGLTGGIATGKSTVSNILRDLGYYVICADTLVKSIYTRQETIDFIKSLVPNAVKDNAIDFPILREAFFSDIEIQQKIEVHIYAQMESRFKEVASDLNERHTFVVYDAPVLFEKELNQKVDLTVCVYTPRETQLKRLIERDGNSEELANKILNGQMDIEEKKIKSDFVIENTGSLEDLKMRTAYIFNQIQF